MNALPAVGEDEAWWVAMVTFEKGEDSLGLLAPPYQGAVGWLAGVAGDEDAAEDLFRAALGEIGLIVLEVGDLEEVGSMADIEDVDEHLALNVAKLEPGKRTVWGELFPYLADGEA